jgi:WD40 repeat protein/tRNA A-37 threonylcarbamoyl transferase component Bud32
VSEPAPPSGESLVLSQARGADLVCDRFEAAWDQDARPRIESYLEAMPEVVRPALLRELLAVELELRRRQGETPEPAEYRSRFAPFAPVVEVVFAEGAPAAAAKEQTVPLPPAGAVPAGDLAPGCVFADYDLLEEVGRGGMGIVYKARHRRLGRVVALKVIRRDRLEELPPEGRRVWLARFEREGRAAALLEHEHIVPVYDVGTWAGQHYYAMRFVPGQTLAELLGAGPLSGPLAAAFLEAVARAVAHAHQRGILHRDLKPRNVLVEAAGKRPLVADFGLAKLLEGEPGLTASGAVLGTPAYMAPEQAQRPDAVSCAADVYGLGATLYHLLTGRPPFQAATVSETLRQVLQEEPVAPRRLNPAVPRDLETICCKCLEKDPQRRYAGAADLADDLGRFRRGEPIRARPLGRPARLGRWCRRNPLTTTLAAAAAAALLLALGLAVFAAVAADGRARAGLRAANEARARAEEQEQAALVQRLLLLRRTEHEGGWRAEAWRMVERLAHLRADESARNEAVATLPGLDARVLLHLEPLRASAVALDPAGRRLLLGGTDDREGRPLSPAQLRDALAAAPRLGSQAGAGPVAFRKDGTALQLVARPGPTLLLWDVGGGRPVCTCRFPVRPDLPRAVAFAHNGLESAVLALGPEGALAAAVGRDSDGAGVLAVWETATGAPRFGVRAEATALAFSADGAWLAAGDRNGRVVVWSVAEGRRAFDLPPVGAMVHGLAFSADGQRLAAGDAGGTVTVWSWRRRAVTAVCRAGPFDVFAVCFTPDGTTLASGGRGPVRLFDTETGRLLLKLEGGDYVSGLAFAAGGRRLAASSLGGFGVGKAHVWQVEDGRGIRTLRGLSSQISQVCLSADGRRLAALAHNWRVGVWEAGSGRLLRRLRPRRESWPTTQRWPSAPTAGAWRWPRGGSRDCGTWRRARWWPAGTCRAAWGTG